MRTVVVCLVGLAGMMVLGYFVAPIIIDKTLVIAGLPPLTGGIVAATIMQQAAQAKGLEVAAVFAIAMYCIQGFAGYPITAICLQKEGRRLLKELRSGEIVLTDEDRKNMATVGLTAVSNDDTTKRLIPPVPDKWNTPVFMFLKLGIVAWLASQLGALTGISGAIWALVLGVVFTTLGFLETNLLTRANSFQIVMFALMMYIFDGLKDCTPGDAEVHHRTDDHPDHHRRCRYGNRRFHHRKDSAHVLPSGICQRSDRAVRIPLRRYHYNIHL